MTKKSAASPFQKRYFKLCTFGFTQSPPPIPPPSLRRSTNYQDHAPVFAVRGVAKAQRIQSLRSSSALGERHSGVKARHVAKLPPSGLGFRSIHRRLRELRSSASTGGRSLSRLESLPMIKRTLDSPRSMPASRQSFGGSHIDKSR